MIGRRGHYNVRTRFELTPRQREVLDLVARGKTNGEIAHALGISLDGVKWHVREILAKFEVESREEAAALWRQEQSPGLRFTRALAGLFGAGAMKWTTTLGAVAVTGGAALGAYALFGGNLPGGSSETASTTQACDPSKVGLTVDATDNPSGTVDITANVRNDGPPCIDNGLNIAVRQANDTTSPKIARIELFDAFPESGASSFGPIEWRNYCGPPGPFEIVVEVAGVIATAGHAAPPACADNTAAASTLGFPPSATANALPNCNAANLVLRVEPNVAGDNVVFAIFVDNTGPRCHIQGTLTLTLGDRDATGIANAVRNNPDAIAINLDVDSVFGADAFAWENWCGGSPPHAFSADAEVDNRIGSSPPLPVPPPKCIDPSQQSQIRSVQASALFNGRSPVATPTAAPSP